MLNPIDSFFQYFVKRVFSMLFLSKKNALHNVNWRMLFYIMFSSYTLPDMKKNNRGLRFDYQRANLFSKGIERSSSENIFTYFTKNFIFIS